MQLDRIHPHSVAGFSTWESSFGVASLDDVARMLPYVVDILKMTVLCHLLHCHQVTDLRQLRSATMLSKELLGVRLRLHWPGGVWKPWRHTNLLSQSVADELWWFALQEARKCKSCPD